MIREPFATDEYQQYQRGIDYKNRIGLYSDVNKNERFYAGRHWEGIPHVNLPTPVLNVLKSGLAWKVAAISERRLKLQFSVMGRSVDDDIRAYIKQVDDYSGILWERLKMDYLFYEVLKDAGISGDGILYFYWDPKIRTGQDKTGDICVQKVDNVNYYPGDVNDPDVQGQPYIILAFRQHIKKVREEAERNGISKDKLELLSGDSDTEHTAGDMGKVELDDNSKCTVFLKMWKEKTKEEVPIQGPDGEPLLGENGAPITEEIQLERVFMKKSTRLVEIQSKTQTKLTRYPVALMNWETRKNSCHGVPELTEMIPNQVFINKTLALAQVCLMNMGFPKGVFDRTKIDGEAWNSELGEMVGINGSVQDAAAYLNPGTMSYDVWRGIQTMIEQTFDMMGANSAVRGNINDPDNTSAFIAVRDAAMVPLQAHQQRFYSFVEDCGLIMLDYMKGYYGGRMIPVEADLPVLDETGQQVIQNGVPLVQRGIQYVPMPDLSTYELDVKVDVGPSTMWSEIQTIQTLDNLVKAGLLKPSEFFERIAPLGVVPDAEKLVTARQEEEQAAMMAQQQQALMAQTA